jgi:hypothetical protein
MKQIKNRASALLRAITPISIAFVLQIGIANAQIDTLKAPDVPANLVVPEGNSLFLKVNATGTQNYICMPTGWTFFGPQATLFVKFKWFNSEIVQQIGTHFLSPNPAEGGTARPTWQGSLDTSSVWARAIANSTDPMFVAPDSIPWLLLQTAGTQRGPGGGATFAQTTYIQRVNTLGGIAPTGACNVGAVALVPYTTDYYFYKTSSN